MSISEHLGHAIRKHESKKREEKEGKGAEAGEINAMNVEKAANGYIVSFHHPKTGEKHSTLFKHSEHHKVARHIQEMMGGPAEPEEDSTGEVSKSGTSSRNRT